MRDPRHCSFTSRSRHSSRHSLYHSHRTTLPEASVFVAGAERQPPISLDERLVRGRRLSTKTLAQGFFFSEPRDESPSHCFEKRKSETFLFSFFPFLHASSPSRGEDQERHQTERQSRTKPLLFATSSPRRGGQRTRRRTTDKRRRRRRSQTTSSSSSSSSFAAAASRNRKTPRRHPTPAVFRSGTIRSVAAAEKTGSYPKEASDTEESRGFFGDEKDAGISFGIDRRQRQLVIFAALQGAARSFFGLETGTAAFCSEGFARPCG